jgi:hypothetical protein
MRYLRLFFAVLALAVVGLAQDLKAVIPTHKAGDTLKYRVEFDGDPPFTSVQLAFNITNPPPKDQPGLSGWFPLNHWVKIRAGVFDVDGTIPGDRAEGEYHLQSVNTAIGAASKSYDTAVFNIRFRLENDTRYAFPDLKSVKPQ